MKPNSSQPTVSAEERLNSIRALAAEHANCSGCPTPWWLTKALEEKP